MPRFLSPEWVDALNEAAAGAPLDTDLRITVHHRIDGAGYTLRVDGGRVRAAIDDGAGADVTFTEDRATALALARGAITAQQAISEGRLKVSGDVTALVAAAPAVAKLSDVLASVVLDAE
jgi:hypothetical protein